MHLDLNLSTIVQVLIAAAMVGAIKSLWSLNTAVADLAGQFKEHTENDKSQFESLGRRLDSIPQVQIQRYLDRP